MPENSNTPSPSDPAGSGVDWDARYREGDTPWDKGTPHPALVDWLAENSLTGRVIVLGCGLGHDVRAIAPAAEVEAVGFDLSATAIEQARKIPAVGGECYVEGDLFHPPEDWTGTFDWVFEHTCFCAIVPSLRAEYVQAVSRLLKPGGRLLAIFFLEPGVEEGPPFGCTVEELRGLFGDGFAFLAMDFEVPTYPGREGAEVRALLGLRDA